MALPVTHRWVYGGIAALTAGRTLLGAGSGVAMWCWNEADGSRVFDLYDANGQPVTEIPVSNSVWVKAGVPKTVTLPLFSVRDSAVRVPGNDADAIRSALLALAPADAAVAALIADTGSASRVAFNSLFAPVAEPIAVAGLALKATIASVTALKVASGTTNTVVGNAAGTLIVPNATDGDAAGGYRNAAFGNQALEDNVRGWKNTAFGHSALRDNVDGYNNVAVGDSALERMLGGIGVGSPAAEDPGARNCAFGSYALRYLTSGRANIGVGRNAGHTITTGGYNTAVGTNALSGTYEEFGTQDVKTLSYCVAMGYNALFSANQDFHTAIGTYSLYSLISGSGDSCTALGYQALKNATNNANSALGHNAGVGVTTGRFNVAIGSSTLATTNTAGRNVAVGASAQRFNNAAASFNVAVGAEALRDNLTGASNTAIGDLAMGTRTGDSNSSALGANSTVTGSNQVQLGDSATTTYAYGAVQNRSDARDKADIADTELGLDFIQALRPRQFRWDYREDYRSLTQDDDGATVVKKRKRDGSAKRTRLHQGLVAQEVEKACQALGVDFAGLQHHKIAGGDDVYSIGYEELIAPLIKAVQQLSAKVAELEQGVSS